MNIMTKRHLLKAALALALTATVSIANLAHAQDAKPATGKVQVQWLGQAAFKITTVAGKVIVIDPWLITNPKRPKPFASSTPWARSIWCWSRTATSTTLPTRLRSPK